AEAAFHTRYAVADRGGEVRIQGEKRSDVHRSYSLLVRLAERLERSDRFENRDPPMYVDRSPDGIEIGQQVMILDVQNPGGLAGALEESARIQEVAALSHHQRA